MIAFLKQQWKQILVTLIIFTLWGLGAFLFLVTLILLLAPVVDLFINKSLMIDPLSTHIASPI